MVVSAVTEVTVGDSGFTVMSGCCSNPSPAPSAVHIRVHLTIPFPLCSLEEEQKEEP